MNSQKTSLPDTIAEASFSITRECRQQLAEAHEELLTATLKTWRANASLMKSALGYPAGVTIPLWQSIRSLFELQSDQCLRAFETVTSNIEAGQHYAVGVLSYLNEFMNPYWTALNSFSSLEKDKLVRTPLLQSTMDYFELLRFNVQIAEQGSKGTMSGLDEFNRQEALRLGRAVLNSLLGKRREGLRDYSAGMARLLDALVYRYPEAIRAIEPEFGFHFDDGGYILADETDRFYLYQVLPRDPAVSTRKHGKPILIMHPYVLGPNILAFLPGENKSYVHAFANQGIPTYIRILKDIQTNPAVQTMTGEDDARDTHRFSSLLKAVHGRPVTLNGFCQGGFIALLDVLSGELDGSVDALITCVAPMDGTRSKSLVEYMQHLPNRFRDLNYAVKDLPNGNRIVDGKVMSWVYKLKSMEKEAPLVTLYRDMGNFQRDGGPIRIGKTAAAMNHWLLYDRNDLPEAITKLSFDSYTIPITADGTLPVTLFGRSLNLHGIREKGIRWLICYAEGDDLVDRDACLAPLDHLEDVEVTPFPKGHGAIATSWSDPDSACALHTRFGSGCRGPVRFQLDLDAESTAEGEKTLPPSGKTKSRNN
ncbi:MAG: metal transporter [Deltaproteobacteria bacterium HGW-Deltaproteobacteria-19]|jgi:hypothetical protein|nr:MAG: metal transporter [Deltaproteobacteria bacterium HGW-Deltaproteobacteria-19]